MGGMVLCVGVGVWGRGIGTIALNAAIQLVQLAIVQHPTKRGDT